MDRIRRRLCRFLLPVLAVMLPVRAESTIPGLTVTHFGNPEPADYEFFGDSVASLGNELVVGAPGSVGFPAGIAGRVYIIDVFGAVSRVIENPTPAVGDQFGEAVAVVGSDILVGAPFDDTVASDAGAAYLFDGTTGALLQTFLVPGSSSNSQCGRAVAALGSNALVGCDGAYLFDASDGMLIDHFTGPGAYTRGDPIGTLGGDVLLAGFDVPGYGTDRVWRLDGTSGALVQTYLDPLPGGPGLFGGSIAAQGNEVLIGRGQFSYPEERAYLYDATTGSLLHTFSSPFTQPPYNDGFGHGVTLAGSDRVIAGWHSTHVFAAGTNAHLGAVTPNHVKESLREEVSTVFGDSFVAYGGDDLGGPGSGTIYLFDRCGNGILTGGEQCDDGNTGSGDGCSAICHLELCPPTPDAGACHDLAAGGKAVLGLKERTSDPFALVNRDQLMWKWRGAATDVAEFGDPTTTTAFQLCIYDNVFATPALRMEVAATGGQPCAGEPCWQVKTAGYRYRDRLGTPSGVTRLDLKAGSDNIATIKMRASGREIGIPGPLGSFGEIPLSFGISVVLRNTTTSACWSATTGDIRNLRGRLKAIARFS